MDHSNIKYVRIISLLLLFAVLLYGGSSLFTQSKATMTTSNLSPSFGTITSNELPIYCVETSDKVVAITFDAAWGDEDLDDILAILNKHNCKATFFVTGDWALRYPDAIEKIDSNGHDIGSHGANHKHMTQISEDEMLSEIQDAHAIIKNMAGKDMDLFRVPYGLVDSIIQTVCEHKHLGNGSIILLHNGSTYTRDALDQVLSGLEKKGYSFVPVSQLIMRENYTTNHEGKQISQ